MKYLLISLLVLGTTSCAFKKVNKTSDDVVSSSSDSGDKLDELELLELEEEKKEKMQKNHQAQLQVQPKPTRRQKGQMSIIDTNADGKISYKEYMLSKKALFQRLDANRDGFLTIEELKARKYQARTERLKRKKRN